MFYLRQTSSFETTNGMPRRATWCGSHDKPDHGYCQLNENVRWSSSGRRVTLRGVFASVTDRYVDIDVPPFNIAAMPLTGSRCCNLWCSCCRCYYYHTGKHDALNGWYRQLRASTLYERAGIGLSPLYGYVYARRETLKSSVPTSYEVFEPDLHSFLKILSATRTFGWRRLKGAATAGMEEIKS